MKRRTIRVAAAGTLEQALRPELGAEASAYVARGAVYLDGRRERRPATPVRQGQVLSVVLEEGGLAVLAKAALPALAVLSEDAALLAVHKPAGLTAQPTEGRAGESLWDLASAHLGHEAGLVHRLDRETSGVTVFGKTSPATTALAAAFREGTARKRYLAVTGPGLPAEGTVDLPLSKDPSRPGRFRATRKANGVDALTRFRRLYDGAFCVVELFPETGRTHQLRAHLTALGCPIAGDARYGGPRELAGMTAERCLLHAQRLELPHPRTGTPAVFDAPAPEDLARFLAAAGLDANGYAAQVKCSPST
jgi:23S rRNA pseudouridine1911/1915/1917 synthase